MIKSLEDSPKYSIVQIWLLSALLSKRDELAKFQKEANAFSASFDRKGVIALVGRFFLTLEGKVALLAAE